MESVCCQTHSWALQKLYASGDFEEKDHCSCWGWMWSDSWSRRG